MIGIFDSGVGGMTALCEVRRLLPKSDVIYLADRKNAPYGTKSEDELTKLVKCDIKRLKELGATDILIACCTASTVFRHLCDAERQGVIPIISPAASVASALKRITVIATEHTVRTSAFSLAIKARSPSASVLEIPCQRLVTLVESGERDGNISRECEDILMSVASSAKEHASEGIILGCTHFSHLEKTIKNLLPKVKIINPARIGARELAHRMTDTVGRGRITYTE